MLLNTEKLIVAVDTADVQEAHEMIDLLKGYAGHIKVGKQLYTKLGPEIVNYIHEKEMKVFLDLKFHDIPNTVRGACKAAADQGISMMTIHASGGEEMMKAAVKGVRESKNPETIILAVTVLTSIDQKALNEELLVPESVKAYVEHLTLMAKYAKVSGVVASPHEASAIRRACGPDFKIVTPGVRPSWADKGDQKRVMTPREAIDAGADYIVVGRPITESTDRMEAAEKILKSLS